MSESVSESLMSSIVNEATADTILSFGESVLDDGLKAAGASEIILKVPVFGVIFAFGKSALEFRERRYASKLAAVLFETSKASQKDKEKYLEKIEKNPDDAKRAGEVLLDIVDKLTSLEKARMVGRVIRAYMTEEDLTMDQLIYLCEIIERTYLQDLMSLEESETQNESNLESVGIRKPVRIEEINQVILNAVNQGVEEATSRAGVLKEAFTAEDIAGAMGKKGLTQIKQSGLTDAGYNLQRILRTYK